MTDYRREEAKSVRNSASQKAYDRAHPEHQNNGDEQRYASANYAMSFTKGLDHNTNTGLVNNAGVLRDGLLVKAKDGVISKMSLDQFNLVMNVNVIGTFLCGREAAVKMIESGSQGVIINISSVARAGNIGQTNYSASKAAVATMATTWARELARYGIRAAAVAPGVVHTAMAEQMKPEAIERLEKMIPVGRMGETSEIAHAVKYIIESDYFTGRVLEVDGGIRM